MGMFKRKIKVETKDAKLPKNRKELFFRLLKEDYFFIVDNGLVIGLFSIPLIVVISTFLLIITQMSDITWEVVTSTMTLFSLLLIPAFAIRYMGKISVFGITKARVQNEANLYSTLFFESFKRNYKKGLLIGLFEGICFVVSIFLALFFLLKTSNNIARGIGIGFSFIFLFISYMVGQFDCSISNFYELNVFESIKNSLSFVFIDLIYSFIYFLIMVVIPCVVTFIFTSGFYIFIFLGVLFFEGMSVIYLTLRSHELFDRYINKENYPDIYHKGLAKED